VGTAGVLGMLARIVCDALVRCRVNPPSPIDRRTGEVVRRQEHDHAGSLIHIDGKKLGNLPTAVWGYVGRQQGDRKKAATAPQQVPPCQDRSRLRAHGDR
jgi:hypothetical protein